MTATKRQKEVNDIYWENNGKLSATADALNISKTCLVKNLFYGARNGLQILQNDLPNGWSSFSKSILRKDGKVVMSWDKVKPEEQAFNEFWEFLEKRTPVLNTIIPEPETVDNKLMLEWLLMDHHLGLHSWGKETGEDYDTKIAKDLLIRAGQKIFSQHGNVGKAVIVLGGDNIHADNRNNRTEKSGNILDVDTRYPKTMDAIYEGMTTVIDIALNKAKEVEVVVLSGNHDYHSSICLGIILAAHYRKNKRVYINKSPQKHKWLQFGNNFFMYSHGDTGTNNRLASYMMNHIIKNNIQDVKRMFVRKGHLHKKGKIYPPGLTDEDGVTVEMFPTLAGKESYVSENAYTSTRATIANIWHKKYGQRSRMELGVDELIEHKGEEK